MTKQQRSGSRLSPSKLCRYLFLAFIIKFLVLGVMLFEPVLFDAPFTGHVSVALQDHGSFTQSVAFAAEEVEPVGAPPALSTVLPDVGMRAPEKTPGGYGMPQPNAATPSPGRALPPIVPKETQGATAQQSGGGDVLTREMLSRKEEELARKEQELKTLESDIAHKLEKMELLENRLSVMMRDAQEVNDAKFRHLVDVLSNMKAKSAAQVLETMEQRTAVRVLAGMRGRQAGEILTFVRPDIAASLTQALTRMQLPLE